METKQVTNSPNTFRARFKARVQEEARKVLRNWETEERRIFEKTWHKAKRSAPLWNEIAF